MVGASGQVGVHTFMEEEQIMQLTSIEITGNVDVLTAQDHQLPAWVSLVNHDDYLETRR